ncbi:MAG: TlpA family protein disulfide reductase [Williamsia sp.]|nr:TlpA family protein disulfide reductase [Williamsia sp.]
MCLQKLFIKRMVAALALMLLLVGSCMAQQVNRVSIAELQSYIQKSEKPLVVNFWATFCKPCVEEIPYFQQAISKQYKGEVELLLVSLDLPADYRKISSFASQKNFSAPIAWLNETDADYFCPKIDPKWSGAIPCTLMINNKKGYRKFYDDQLSTTQLEKELKALVQ